MIDPSLFPNLENFKLGYTDTLFQPLWEALLQDRCPLCSCKLKFPFKKSIAICTSKKHANHFVIHLTKLEEIKRRSKKEETVEDILPVHSATG